MRSIHPLLFLSLAAAASLHAQSTNAEPLEENRQAKIAAALEALRSKEPGKRSNAVRLLSEETRAIEVIPELKKRLFASRDANERSAALQALAFLDAIDIVPLVRPLLEDRSSAVREAAVFALAMFEDAESRTRVGELLRDACARANKDQLLHIGMLGVTEVEPALERIVRNAHEDWSRRWGATQALAMLEAQESASSIAEMVASCAQDATLALRRKSELLSAGLRSLAVLAPEAHRALFEEHRNSADREVRDEALSGLLRCGDPEALSAIDPASRAYLALPETVRKKLESTRLRLSQVKGCTLREVLAVLQQRLEMPIEVSPNADPRVLEGRFVGYVAMLGYHPRAFEILNAVRPTTFSFMAGQLEPVFGAEKIQLLLPEERAKLQAPASKGK